MTDCPDLGGGKYFACVDMKGTDGKTYDIDFFLTGLAGNMKVAGRCISQDRWQTALQLERRKQQVEQSAGELRNEPMKLAMRFAVVAASFLACALTVHAASQPSLKAPISLSSFIALNFRRSPARRASGCRWRRPIPFKP